MVAAPVRERAPGRRPVRAASLALVLALAATEVRATEQARQGAEPDEARSATLRHLLVHDCGSCHGMTLRGGLGPPLTAAALASRPPAVLEATIAHGRPGTPMPPWGRILSEGEIRWLVDGLRNGRFETR